MRTLVEFVQNAKRAVENRNVIILVQGIEAYLKLVHTKISCV